MATRSPRFSPTTWSRHTWAHRAREIAADPSIIAGILPAAGVVAILGVLPSFSWSTPEMITLVTAIVGGTFLSVVWFVVARRWTFPMWGRHVGIALGNVLLTAVVVATSAQHLNMANLYFLSATAAILLFSLRAAFAHFAVSGILYAAVLAFGPPIVGSPVVAWLAVFGTTALVGTVAVGLVSQRLAASTDPLTGLANRRAWDRHLESEMVRARRTGTPLTIALIDLNGFKEVNDVYGHAAGDQLLKDIAHAWQQQIRGGGDILARVGGDEFAVLTSDSGQAAMRKVIKRFTKAAPPGVYFSAGEATWDRMESASDLVQRADDAMYTSKTLSRRNQSPDIA